MLRAVHTRCFASRTTTALLLLPAVAAPAAWPFELMTACCCSSAGEVPCSGSCSSICCWEAVILHWGHGGGVAGVLAVVCLAFLAAGCAGVLRRKGVVKDIGTQFRLSM